MSRIAILADIHSNAPAFKEVLIECKKHSPELYLIAGDIVGYNPFPNEVISELMRIRFKEVVQGNHDRAVVTGNTSWFSGDASAAVKWTRKNIKDLNLKFLFTRKDKLRLNVDGKHILMCHGAPWDPDEYILANQVEEDMLRENRVDVLIMGHTHIPFAKKYSSGIVINPGSVGQPRDGDPRASGSILDTETMEVTKLRVDYDIDAVADAIMAKGLPETLAQRLSYGV